MAMDFACALSGSYSVEECKTLLISQIGLEVSPHNPRRWLVNTGTIVTVSSVTTSPHGGRLDFEVFGFMPTLTIEMRPRMGGPHAELGAQTVVRIVDALLHHSTADLGFAYEHERVLLLRRHGQTLLRNDFERWITKEELALITVPWERAELRP